MKLFDNRARSLGSCIWYQGILSLFIWIPLHSHNGPQSFEITEGTERYRRVTNKMADVSTTIQF